MSDQDQNDDYEWLVGRQLSLGVVMRVIEGADAMIRQDANTVLRMEISDLLHEDYRSRDRHDAELLVERHNHEITQKEALEYKDMFHDAIRTLAAIDEALDVEDNGEADPELTLEAIEALKAKQEDSELFHVWITEASLRPGRVAAALASCVTPEDYRTALRRLRDE